MQSTFAAKVVRDLLEVLSGDGACVVDVEEGEGAGHIALHVLFVHDEEDEVMERVVLDLDGERVEAALGDDAVLLLLTRLFSQQPHH